MRSEKMAIDVVGVGKQFLRRDSFRVNRMRDAVDQWVKSWRTTRSQKTESSGSSEAKALDQVSFSVSVGEVLGIVGNNGAGKTTLLKILSRITPPSEGRAMVRGKVASLLGVGAGFHPELTGRENILLNGAILGMSKKRVEEKFDSIVSFSGVADSLEVPVKHFSSGMYARLAFAVAIHLDAEVLLIDEVLAVGDIGFQEKSVEAIKTASQNAKTVLFVSHEHEIMRRLANRVLWLESGRIRQIGEVNSVLDSYLSHNKRAH